MGRPRLGTIAFYLVGLGVLGACWRPALPAPRFASSSPSLVSSAQSPDFQWHMIDRPEGVLEVHAASLVRLPKNELLCVFFGGSSECAVDVKLYQSRFRDGAWQPAKLLIAPEDVGRAENRYTRRVGNTTMFRDPRGRIHLFFVSVGFGGWAGSSINRMISTDDGETWSPPTRLITSPFFNMSTLVRHPGILLECGGFLLPLYFELTNKFPEILQFDADGCFVRKIRMDGQHGSLQPCMIPLDDKRALAFLRNRCLHDGWLLFQQTQDGGETWSPPAPLEVTNIDSPVAVVRFADGLFLQAYNPTRERDRLMLAVSTEGRGWRAVGILEEKGLDFQAGRDEYSYPTMLVDGDEVDVVFSSRRQGIRHIRFNRAWVKESMRE